MIKKSLFALVFCSALWFSQERKNYKQGVITTITSETVPFSDLTWDKNGKATYTNNRTSQQETLYENSIKSIKDNLTDNEVFFNTTTTIEAPNEKKQIETPVNDNLYRPDFPEGTYLSKNDFINKTPSNKNKVVKKSFASFDRDIVGDNAQLCFFYDASSDTKIKNAFAIVYHGILYFNIKAILSNRNKTDRAQDNDNPNSFVRVTNGGDNYLYTEATLANGWAKGLAYGGIGGAAGSTLAHSLDTQKGIVWDYKNQEFNIFKNCKDYNAFITPLSPKDIQACPKQQADIIKVREAIDKIK